MAAIAPSTEPYQIVNSGPHERVWQRLAVDAQGATNAQAYTELATGLNFFNLATGNWEPSRELFQITKDGFAVATNGQHKTIIAPDVAAPDGVVDFLGPDGQRLLSNPRALVYRDAASDKSVVIALVTNCVGELSSPNVVVFPTAFDSVKAAISYTYTKLGLEQDVIIYRRIPSPSDLNADLSPDSTVLEIWTEFLIATEPAVSFGASAADQTLDFGQTRMGRGVAYFQNAAELQPVPLEKTWQDIDSRHFLVESVSYSKIKPLLDKLQASAAPAKKSETARLLFPDRQKLVTAAIGKKSNSHLIASIRSTSTQHDPGLVLDYQTLNTSLTNLTLQANTTYFVSAPINVSATGGSPALTIEGLSVVKFTNDASAKISFSGPVLCKTGPYRMAVMSSMSDDSVGDPISGSTGSPTNFNGATYLSSSIFGSNSYTNSYRYLRFAFAGRALDLLDDSHSDIWHCQFVNCATALSWCDDCSGAFYGIHNALFAQCGTLNGYGGGGFKGEHITADGGSLGACNCGNFTNCILTGVTNTGSATFDHCVNNSSSAGLFQSAGAGNYYLADGSTNRNAGTTNINSKLLSDLKQRTTYPPIVYSNVTWSANTTLSPQAQRDTDALDLGYHYASIDFITHMFQITNCSLTLAPGTAIACYNWTGIWIQEGGSITSVGTPIAPNWLVPYQGVQEQPLALGGGTTSWSVNAYHTGTPVPTGTFRFTRFVTSPGGGNQFYNSSWSFGSLLLQDSEVWGGVNKFDGATNTTIILRNNLFNRGSATSYNTTVTNSLSVSNNLFWSVTSLAFHPVTSGLWSVFNNEFDSCSLWPPQGTLTSGNNAYWNCNKQLTPTNSSDITLTSAIAYQSGPLGDFYQLTNSPLINLGSCTANLAGLYHYTVTTNLVSGQQIKETNSVTDIGLHYIAVDSNGLPEDADGDLLPDYLEDTTGDGTYNSGDLSNWQSSDTDGDGVNDYIEYIQGRNPRVSGAVSDTNNVLNLRLYTPLK